MDNKKKYQPKKKNMNQAAYLLKNHMPGNKELLEKIAEEVKLDFQQVLELRASFDRYDVQKFNEIQWFEVDDVYRDLGFDITPTIRATIKNDIAKDNKKPDFKKVCEIYKKLMTCLEEEAEDLANLDYINAFAALGGNPNKTGFVSKSNIIKTIKEDFQLDFDIEEFLDILKISKDELNFQDFCTLFDSTEEGRTIASMLTDNLRSQVNSREFQVNYQDFERWDRRQNGDNIQGLKLRNENETD